MDAREGPGKRLRRDPIFAARVGYCAPLGIPLSQFLRWSKADQDVAVAWHIESQRRCSSCGTHPDDWDPDAGGHLDAYVPATEICPGCAKAHTGQAMYRDDLEQFPGARLVLARNPDPKR